MKINLLHMIIIATALSSLQIDTMGPKQQIAFQQAHQYFTQPQQQHNYNTIVSTTSNCPDTPRPFNINSNTTPIVSEEVFTMIALDNDGSNTTDPILTQDNNNEAVRLMERTNPHGINLIMEENTVLVGCCSRNAICTKTTVAKILCGICVCSAGFITLALAMANKL